MHENHIGRIDGWRRDGDVILHGERFAAFGGAASVQVGYAGLLIGAILAGLVYVVIALIIKVAGVLRDSYSGVNSLYRSRSAGERRPIMP